MNQTSFWKYQAVGNSYIIIEGEDPPAAAVIQTLCSPQWGIGSDGVLIGRPLPDGRFHLRIFNPDGSEAEKSGNGIRIFARWVWDEGLTSAPTLDITTAGGPVRAFRHDDPADISVEMGRARVFPDDPQQRPGHFETLMIRGEACPITLVSLGNPHCVLFRADVSAAACVDIGPLIENHARFPQRTNVQLARVVDDHTLEIQIWERGAGYTLSSGSSACAVAAAAVFHQQVQTPCTVIAPGGRLTVMINDQFEAILRGDVHKIAQGTFF